MAQDLDQQVPRANAKAPKRQRESAQPVMALRSITDVQMWLKSNDAALSSSGEAQRIKDVTDCFLEAPKPRQEVIEKFFKPWGVQRRTKGDRRPLPELIEELSQKVVITLVVKNS